MAPSTPKIQQPKATPPTPQASKTQAIKNKLEAGLLKAKQEKNPQAAADKVIADFLQLASNKQKKALHHFQASNQLTVLDSSGKTVVVERPKHLTEEEFKIVQDIVKSNLDLFPPPPKDSYSLAQPDPCAGLISPDPKTQDLRKLSQYLMCRQIQFEKFRKEIFSKMPLSPLEKIELGIEVPPEELKKYFEEKRKTDEARALESILRNF